MNNPTEWIDKLPMEAWFGIAAGGGVLFLLCWHGLTRNDPVGKPVSSYGFTGGLLILIGIAGAFYFSTYFSVSAASVNGMPIANLDLLNQRQIGVMISLAAVIIGVVLCLFGAREKSRSENPFGK
ncbi:MAG: hypothetical protein H7Y43_08010 [Akkermansiaceae bacterium]|nr:hypothetical protein [Verrucomicrobiales bacterium]